MYFEDIEIGERFPVIKNQEITRVQLVRYAGASGDFNPLHTVEEVGKKAGSGVIAHGMLIMGLASKGITKWIPRKYIKNVNVRFKRMTFPGEVIEVTGKVMDKLKDNTVVGEVIAKSHEGEIKLAGTFEAVLPSRT